MLAKLALRWQVFSGPRFLIRALMTLPLPNQRVLLPEWDCVSYKIGLLVILSAGHPCALRWREPLFWSRRTHQRNYLKQLRFGVRTTPAAGDQRTDLLGFLTGLASAARAVPTAILNVRHIRRTEGAPSARSMRSVSQKSGVRQIRRPEPKVRSAVVG